ncbi:MAG: hypothetical protein V4692_07880, partial [Bdellovibrionota bacterium]
MMFGKLILSLFVALTFALPSTSQAGDDDLQYFKQFMYKVIPTGDDPDFPTYRYEVLGTDVFHE